MKTLKIIFCIFVTVYMLFALKVPDTELKDILADSLVSIISELRKSKPYCFDITVGYVNRTGQLLLRDILNRVLRKNHNTIAMRIAKKFVPISDSKFLRKYNIFLVDSIESFDHIAETVTDETYDFGGYFVVVLATQNLNLHESLEHIFRSFYYRFIANVAVIYANRNRVNIFIFFPFTENHCDTVLPVLYNSYRNGSFVRDLKIFPDKLTNFFGCSINVVTWQFLPHFTFRKLANQTLIPEGIDGFILQALQSEFNFTINYMMPANRDDRGTIYPNGSSTGAHKMMIEGNGNMTICGYGYTQYRYTYLTASTYYYYSTFVIVKPGQPPYTSLERLFFPFNYVVWWCIAFIFIIGFVITTILKLVSKKSLEFLIGSGINSPILEMFNTAIGGSATILPKAISGRTLVIIWILANIVIRSAYQGLLFTFLQQNIFKKIPQTLGGLLAEGYGIYSPKSFISIFDTLQIPRERCEDIVLPIEPYFERTQDPKYKRIMITTHFQVARYNSENWSVPAVDLLPQRIFQLPMVALYKKNSYLKEPFDHILHKLIGSGLIDHWASLYMNRTAQPENQKTAEKPITLDDFSGTFALCAVVMGFALVVFVLEIISVKNEKIRKLIEFYTF